MHETADQDDVDRLLEFLRGRDVSCPLCRYSLRDLTRPQCPECHHDLVLTVGFTKPRFLWFLAAVSPCAFSGIAAVLLLIPMMLQMLSGGGYPHAPIFALEALGWLSALGGFVLVHHRFAFLRQTPSRQRVCAVAVWGLHVLAFLMFVLILLIITGGP